MRAPLLALAAAFAACHASQAPLAPSGNVWRQFGHDNQNSRRSPNIGPQTTPTAVWQSRTGGDTSTSPTLGPDGTVYQVGNAINGQTGKWVWMTGYDFASSLTVSPSGILYGATRQDSAFYALNATNGQPVWKNQYTTIFGLIDWSSPTLSAAGRIYWGCWDRNIYCMDGETGDVIWQYSTNSYVGTAPALSQDENVVYVGGRDGFLYALHAITGALLWSANLNNEVSSPSLSSDGKLVYAGSFDNHLYAVHASNGSIAWAVDMKGWVASSPALTAQGDVIVGSNANTVSKVHGPTGSLMWQYKTPSYVLASPSIDGKGTAIVACGDGNLYALSGDTGAVVWTFKLSYPSLPPSASVAIGANGMVYAFGNGGYIFALQ